MVWFLNFGRVGGTEFFMERIIGRKMHSIFITVCVVTYTKPPD